MTDSPSHAGTACDALFADCYFLQHQYVIIKNPFNNPLLSSSIFLARDFCGLGLFGNNPKVFESMLAEHHGDGDIACVAPTSNKNAANAPAIVPRIECMPM